MTAPSNPAGNPATYDDVVRRWRPLDTQEQTNATTFLDDAWREVRRRVPDLAQRIAVEDDDQPEGQHGDLHAETVRVLASAVLRVLKNIDGTKREGMDNSMWEPDEAAASGLLVIRDAELAPLHIAPQGQTGGAHVISLGG